MTFNKRYIELNIPVSIKLANPNLHISFCCEKSFDFGIFQFILCENRTKQSGFCVFVKQITHVKHDCSTQSVIWYIMTVICETLIVSNEEF